MVAEWQRVFRQTSRALSSSWQRAPCVFLQRDPYLAGRLGLADVAALVDKGVLPVGCAELGGTQGRGTWSSAPLGAPLRQALPGTTVYANNAGLYLPALAELSLAAVDTLGWPITCNAYLTGAGREVSVPPHTDRQDVLVLQTAGHKHWSVYAPPAISAVDPLRRGKDGDELSLEALGDPLLEVTLRPGDALYVPLGFPHATSTRLESSSSREQPGDDSPGVSDSAVPNEEASVHITVNVDSLIWGLSYRLLWAASEHAATAAAKARGEELVEAKEPETVGMQWSRYAALQAPLHLGFLEEGCQVDVAADLRRRVELWSGDACGDGVKDADIEGAMQMLRGHREKLLQLHRQMYMDVLLGLSGDLSPLEREMGHWQLLQEQMSELRRGLGWE